MIRLSLLHLNKHAQSRAFVCAALVSLGTGLGLAQSAEDLRMTVGKSVVIDYPSDIRQISTSNPDVVDASPVTTREILLHGKGLGAATMVVWSKTGQRTFYNVNVELNLDSLRRMLKETFPNENFTAYSSRDSISLNGRVASKDVADRALALTAAYSKVVVNNLQVDASPIDKQILLRVKFAELDRQKELQYGVNLMAAPGNNPIGTSTGQFGSLGFTGTAIVPQGASSSVSSGSSTSAASASTAASTSTATQGTSNGSFTISQVLSLFAFDPKLNLGAFIKALQTENVLQILAEPNLVTTNNKEATFFVGGQFPVPILQGGANAGAVTVQFKDFGIRLRFTPLVTANKTIKLHLRQEVSTLDTSVSVTLNGFNIPGTATREAETDVELGDGQSFGVSGLLDNRDTENFAKLPFLSSIPVLGNLFKSKTTNKTRTELVLLVTPQVTEPLGPNDPRPEIAFPKDFLVHLSQADIQAAKDKSSGKKN